MHVNDHTAYATYVCQKTRQKNHTAKVVDITPIQIERSFLLTHRELEILDLVVQEYSSKQIAAKLHISNHTVISHRKNMMEKLEVKSVVGLVRWWCERRTIIRH